MSSNTEESGMPAVPAKRPSFLDKLDSLALAVAGASLVGMAAVEAWQVFARYVLNASPSWTETVALLLMSTALMLGAALGVRREAHFGFLIVVEALPAAVRSKLQLAVRLVVAAIGILFAVYGLQLTLDSWPVPTAGMPLPQGVAYLPVTVGGALIAVFAIERIVAPRTGSGE
jgi:TRAP-type C4-dicarboxylate transport system permease small subunit